MICDNCEKVTDSRIGLTLRGPFVCKDCFNIRGSLLSKFTLDGKKVTRQPDITLPAEREYTHAAQVIHSCNRHVDCDVAIQVWLEKHPGKTRTDIPFSFHCHDDECEDCFGS